MTYEIVNVLVKKNPAEPIVVAIAAMTIGYHAVLGPFLTGATARRTVLTASAARNRHTQ